MKKSILFITLMTISVISTISCSKSSNGGNGFLSSGTVIISEVKKNSHLTLKNETNDVANLGNWKLIEIRQFLFGGKDTNSFVIPAGTVLNKSASISFNASTMRFILGADETVYLYNSQGTLISQKYWMFFN